MAITNSRRLAGGTAALATLALLATACGSNSDTDATSGTTDATTAATSAAATTAAANPTPKNAVTIKAGDKQITVAIVPKLLGLPVFEANVKGAKEVASDLNESIDYTASVEASGADQAQVIEGLVNSNNPPDVIAYSANDPTSIVPALNDATAKGIKVIGFDSDVTASARSYFIQDTAYDSMGKALTGLPSWRR